MALSSRTRVVVTDANVLIKACGSRLMNSHLRSKPGTSNDSVPIAS